MLDICQTFSETNPRLFDEGLVTTIESGLIAPEFEITVLESKTSLEPRTQNEPSAALLISVARLDCGGETLHRITPSNVRAEISAMPDLEPTKTTEFFVSIALDTSKSDSMANEIPRFLTVGCGAARAEFCERNRRKSKNSNLNFKPIPEIGLEPLSLLSR